MTATLTSTDFDNDRCPRCGIHLSGTDVVDKAKAWTAMAEKNDEIERLRAALAECAADFSTKPGTVISAAAEINSEFQRRMEIAGRALNGSAPRR